MTSIVDGIQFIGKVIIMKSYDLPAGYAEDCVQFLQGFTLYWKNYTGSQDESGSGLVFLMLKISGHGLSPYPLTSWIVVDSCTVGDGLQPKPGDICGSYRHSLLMFRMLLTSCPYIDNLGKNCLQTFIPLECHTANDPKTSWRISCPSLPSVSYDCVQYQIPHVSALFHYQVSTLTGVDFRPSIHQILVITPLTTTCLYPGGMDMTVNIITTGNPFNHRSSAPSVHSRHSPGGTILAPSSHKDWQSFFQHSGTSTDLSTLSHELHEAQDKASGVFSDSPFCLESRITFCLDALITTSEKWDKSSAMEETS